MFSLTRHVAHKMPFIVRLASSIGAISKLQTSDPKEAGRTGSLVDFVFHRATEPRFLQPAVCVTRFIYKRRL